MSYVYFLKSLKNNKVYVSQTGKSPQVRLAEHNMGSDQWSKNNKPFILIYYEAYFCKKDCLMREKFYKTGFGKKIKKAIIQTLE